MIVKRGLSAMRNRSAPPRSLAAFALVTLAALPAAADLPAPPPTAPTAGTSAAASPVAPAGTAPAVAAPPPASSGTPLNTTPMAGAAPVPPGAAPPMTWPVPPPGAPFVGAPAGMVPPWTAPPSPEATAQFKRKKQHILAGAIVFGLGYYTSLAVSSAGISRGGRSSRQYIPGLIPVVGPFITAGLRAEPNKVQLNGNPPESDFAGMSAYLALGVLQSVGAGLFLAGLRMPTGQPPSPCADSAQDARRPCPRAPAPLQVSFQPILSPTFAGGGLTGVF